MATLHSRVWPPAPTVASVLESGLNATVPVNAPARPTFMGRPTWLPVLTCHTRAVPSAPTVASRAPSGLNASDPYEPLPPEAGNPVPTGTPVAAVKNRTPPAATATVPPFGLRATAVTTSWLRSCTPSGRLAATSHSRTVPRLPTVARTPPLALSTADARPFAAAARYWLSMISGADDW